MDKLRPVVHAQPAGAAPTTPPATNPQPPADDDDALAADELRPKYRQLPLRFDDQVRPWQAPVVLDWPGKQAKLKATVLSDYFCAS